MCHQLCTLHCELCTAAINCALSTVDCALLPLTVHFALCTVHCHQMKTKCVEIQPDNQHCCSADARSTYKLLFFLLLFQGNTWAICMKTNILLIVPRSSCRVWTNKATIISLVLTILVAIAVLRSFSLGSLIENMLFPSLIAILRGYHPCSAYSSQSFYLLDYEKKYIKNT